MSLDTTADHRIIMSTDALPRREREEVARDFFGRIAMRLDLAPHEDNELRLDTSTLCLPDITTSFGAVNPMSWHRTGELLSDGNDDLCISWMAGKYLLTRPGHDDIETRPGSGCLTALDQRWRGTTLDGSWMMCVHFKRAALGHLVDHIEDIEPTQVTGDRPEGKLLFDYLRSIHAMPAASRHAPMFAHHLTDLLGLALGAHRDGQEQAQGGVRAARLAAVKRHIGANLGSARLSAETTARSLKLSSRYIRALFSDEGTTFSDYVNERRLKLAYERLHGAGGDRQTVADIAFEVGFAEPSTFYRLFKARYQMTPSDVRVH